MNTSEEERDDFADPEMRRRLEDWGREVAGPSPVSGPGPPGIAGRPCLFPPPTDLSSLHRALDAVDRELSGAARVRGGRRAVVLWLRRGGLLAASLSVVAAVWWLLRDPGAGAPPLAVLSGLHVSLDKRLLRSELSVSCHSGDTVYLHFQLDRPAWAFAAMLDSKLEFGAVSSSVNELGAGAAVLGHFQLDENAGTESFVVITCTERRSVDEFREAVEAAAAAAKSKTTHDEKLAAVLAELRRQEGLSAGAVTFEHLPR